MPVLNKLSASIYEEYISGKYNYINDKSNHKFLSKEDELILIEMSQSGDEKATSILLKFNQRLILKEVNKKQKNINMATEDLESEGSMGLLHAIKKFDISQGTRLTTYATLWINQYIDRSIMNNSRMVRFPVHVIKKISKINRARKKLTDELKQIPTLKEVSELSGIPEDVILKLDDLNSKSYVISNLVSDDSGESLDIFDTLASDSEEIKDLEAGLAKAKTNELLNRLSSNEQSVIIMKFGLYETNEKSFNDIGKMLSISGSRAQQICKKAIELLKVHLRARDMEFTDFFEVS